MNKKKKTQRVLTPSPPVWHLTLLISLIIHYQIDQLSDTLGRQQGVQPHVFKRGKKEQEMIFNISVLSN